MSKPATHYKVEFIDLFGDVVWDVSAHSQLDPVLRGVIERAGYKVQRPDKPDLTKPLPLLYSDFDPDSSVRAAHEHAARRSTQLGRVVMLLIEHVGRWVTLAEIRAVGGAHGDRRLRELRQLNWPIECRPSEGGGSWEYRLVLPSEIRQSAA